MGSKDLSENPSARVPRAAEEVSRGSRIVSKVGYLGPAGTFSEEALLSATSVAARAIGLQDHIGTIEPGRLADLAVLDGDVLSEPELLLDPGRIWLVLQLGEVVAGAALEAPLWEH